MLVFQLLDCSMSVVKNSEFVPPFEKNTTWTYTPRQKYDDMKNKPKKCQGMGLEGGGGGHGKSQSVNSESKNVPTLSENAFFH